MPNPNTMLFSLMLITSTISVMAANSWFTIWLALEMNLMSFLPLITTKSHHTTETSIKYFLVQALASSTLLLIIMNLQNEKNLYLAIMIPILMKLGAPPLHFWFTNIMEGLNWKNSLILMTWQKIAPLSLIPLYPMKSLIILASMISIFTGSIGGINQTSIRKLLTFSSINHLGWMMLIISINEPTWTKYLTLYSMMMISITIILNTNIYNIKQLYIKSNPMKATLISLNIMSLMGLPPLMGFFPKWISVQLISSINNFTLSIMMIMMSLPITFFYLYLIYHNLTTYCLSNPWKLPKTNILMTTSFIITLSLPIVSTTML